MPQTLEVRHKHNKKKFKLKPMLGSVFLSETGFNGDEKKKSST